MIDVPEHGDTGERSNSAETYGVNSRNDVRLVFTAIVEQVRDSDARTAEAHRDNATSPSCVVN